MENSLLLFSPEFPCWDAETVARAGDAPESLARLDSEGLVDSLGGGYVLTPKGEIARQQLSAEICVPAAPVTEFLTDEAAAARALEHNLMCVYMDSAFKTQWGIKEVTYHETFPVTPGLADDKYFSLVDGVAQAIWTVDPLIDKFYHSFPAEGVAARKIERNCESK